MRTERPLVGLALSVGIVVIDLVGFGLVLLTATSYPDVRPYDYWREALVNCVPFGFVTVLLLLRRPDNRTTWLFTGLTLAGGLQVAFGQYGTLSVRAGLSLPGEVTALWISEIAQTAFVMFLLLLFLYFPTGKLPSRRWAPVALTLAAGFVAQILFSALRPGSLDLEAVSNPYAVPSGSTWLPTLDFVADFGAISGVIGAIACLVVRLARSTGVQRQQLKWFVFTTLLAVTLLFASGLIFPELTEGSVGSYLWALLPASIGVSAALAILRYRLYDIDLVINRALVYGSLTAILAATYLALVVVLQELLRPFTTESDLVVAASTLGVAALFRPLRTRLQGFIDRRFYRSRYDAAETLGRFTTHLREQVDLEALGRELVGAVVGTMQPAHASLWLRRPSPDASPR